MTGARDRLGFGQRVILTVGLAAALAVTGGYLTAAASGRQALSGQAFSGHSGIVAYPVFLSGGGPFPSGGAPGWARPLAWLALAGLWSAAALFLLSGPRPDSGPLPRFRVAAVIGLAVALGAAVTAVPALAGQEALWLARSSGQAGLIILSSAVPGWAVLLILLAVIAAWSAAAVLLLRGRGG